MGDPFFEQAARLRRKARADFQDHLEALFRNADDELAGNLLNKRGKAAGISAFSLFYGRWDRVEAYASDELLCWFGNNPRFTWEEYAIMAIEEDPW